MSRQSATRWFHAGVLPVPARQLVRGTILVDEPAPKECGVALYARPSSADQRGDLDRQVARLVAHATTKAMAATKVVSEVGSGLNGHRTKLLGLLKDPEVGTIVVEHRDRPARFGVEYPHCSAGAADQGRHLVVVENAEVTEHCSAGATDMVEVLTSFCARLYGRRLALVSNHLSARRVLVVLAIRSGASPEEAEEWADGLLGPLPWTLAALRRGWNQAKAEVAPWWAESSEECYSSGLDSLARGLDAWSKSRRGARQGRKVGFPRFKARHARRSFKVTTGSFGVVDDRHVRLPRIGVIRTKEPTTGAAVRGPTVGVDVGVKALAVLSTGEVVPNPKHLSRHARRMARLQAQCSRRAGPAKGRPPSKRWSRSKARLADRWYPSSKTCSRCKAVKAKLALSERIYRCQAWGLVADRDANAAALACLVEAVTSTGTASGAGTGQGSTLANAQGDDRFMPSGRRSSTNCEDGSAAPQEQSQRTVTATRQRVASEPVLVGSDR